MSGHNHSCSCSVLLGSSNSAAAAKPLQSCPTLCDPIDGSPPGFPVPGILQARTLEWVVISFSNAFSVVSDSVRPHRRQPSRLPCPWNSPGKNTGVGCHFLLQCMKVKSESEVAQSCPTQRPHGLQPTRLLRPWNFPGKSTGVGCHCLLQQCISWFAATAKSLHR